MRRLPTAVRTAPALACAFAFCLALPAARAAIPNFPAGPAAAASERGEPREDDRAADGRQSVGASAPRELLAAGHADEAIEALRRQIDHSPQDAEALNLLCRAYFMLEEWDRGIPPCERAAGLDPRNSLYHLWLGRIYGEKADGASFWSAAGLAKKVRSEFERAVELAPGNWQARTDLAEFYLEAPGIVGGGKDKARVLAQALMSLHPAMGHWVLGRIAEKNKDLAGAEREYRAAIEASRGGAHAWLNLALFYRNTKRFDEMEQALRTLETAPIDRPEALMDGASVLLRAGRNHALGIRLLRRCLSAPPAEEAPAFKLDYLMGELLEKQGDRQAAAEEYRAALKLARSYARAHEALKRMER